MLRRSFLAGAAVLAADRRPVRPWRKIHLDFHNSEHVARIGERFDADEFAGRLAEAHVNAIVVFAKDMHGYFYYPSRYGPVHPGLKFDLLGAQVEACRRRRIAVYAYYCTTWDNYLAAHHDEWLVRKRDGSTYLPKPDQTPGWTALCIAHAGFVDLVAAHTAEFVGRYALDGAYFDMPVPIGRACYCPACQRILKSRGLDPNDAGVQAKHKQELEIAFLRRLRETVSAARPGCAVDFNGQACYGLAERAPFQDSIDLEALPTAAAWGYFYFPLTTRYVRSFGLTTYGMTGRFKASWADFGGLKLPNQLLTECASIVANGARCDIGDQMPPSGRLDPAVYHVIGKAYGHIEKIEPYLEGAAPVTEAALLIGGPVLQWPNSDANLGWTKLLTELRVQFDVLETGAAWEKYPLVVLPEGLPVSAAVAARLQAYAARGGKLMVSHTAGLVDAGEKTWLEKLGFSYHGPSPFKPAYLVPQAKFTGDIPPYEYALYEGASQWRTAGTVLARLGEPAFQRGPRHYTSHAQSPFDHLADYAAVAQSGGVTLFGYPVGTSYFTQGYWVYREALRYTLPPLLLTTNAPLAAELTVTRQPGRYLVHIVNWSANRGAPRHPVFYEDPAPLTDVSVHLNQAVRGRARAAVSGMDLEVKQGAVVVPRIPTHEIVVFDEA
jgi:hypothetical protein